MISEGGCGAGHVAARGGTCGFCSHSMLPALLSNKIPSFILRGAEVLNFHSKGLLAAAVQIHYVL